MANVTSLKKGGTGVLAGSNAVIIPYSLNIATAISAGLATTNYVDIVSVPADTNVEVLGFYNDTALSLGTSPAISFGDTGSATAFVNASSTVTADTAHTLATTQKTYAAADTLRITVTGGTLASGTIRVTLRFSKAAYTAPATCPTL